MVVLEGTQRDGKNVNNIAVINASTSSTDR